MRENFVSMNVELNIKTSFSKLSTLMVPYELQNANIQAPWNLHQECFVFLYFSKVNYAIKSRNVNTLFPRPVLKGLFLLSTFSKEMYRMQGSECITKVSTETKLR